MLFASHGRHGTSADCLHVNARSASRSARGTAGGFLERTARRVTSNLAFFAAAAFFEIAGCFAFWLWARRGAGFAVVVLGVASLIAFAFSLTRIESAFAGRAYATYGGIYIAASLIWLWTVEGQAPTRADLIGAGLAVAGAIVIIAFAARTR